MSPEDLDRVMEIAASLKDAPQWPREAYTAALDMDPNQDATPRRIALVTDGGQAGKVMGLAVASLIPPQAELETIAADFPGVEQAFAIQAGRELRVIVSSKQTTDESAARICREIAKAFEERLTYPGEIKVTVLRETRHVEMAR